MVPRLLLVAVFATAALALPTTDEVAFFSHSKFPSSDVHTVRAFAQASDVSGKKMLGGMLNFFGLSPEEMNVSTNFFWFGYLQHVNWREACH